jgi:putative membrane protein
VGELVAKIVINAAALWVAVQVLPGSLLSFKFGNDWWKLLVVALIFALINSYIRPIVKALSFPITILTLSIVSTLVSLALTPRRLL